jgi:hypothetical protein
MGTNRHHSSGTGRIAVIPARRSAASATQTGRPTRSDELCRDALRAYERCYRALDFDEPDVSANVSYAVCRTRLERRALAEPFVVPAERAERLRHLVDEAMAATDARILAAWFQGFPERVLAELERRAPSRGGSGRALADDGPAVAADPDPGLGRRAGDRLSEPSWTPASPRR